MGRARLQVHALPVALVVAGVAAALAALAACMPRTAFLSAAALLRTAPRKPSSQCRETGDGSKRNAQGTARETTQRCPSRDCPARQVARYPVCRAAPSRLMHVVSLPPRPNTSQADALRLEGSGDAPRPTSPCKVPLCWKAIISTSRLSEPPACRSRAAIRFFTVPLRGFRTEISRFLYAESRGVCAPASLERRPSPPPCALDGGKYILPGEQTGGSSGPGPTSPAH